MEKKDNFNVGLNKKFWKSGKSSVTNKTNVVDYYKKKKIYNQEIVNNTGRNIKFNKKDKAFNSLSKVQNFAIKNNKANSLQKFGNITNNNSNNINRLHKFYITNKQVIDNVIKKKNDNISYDTKVKRILKSKRLLKLKKVSPKKLVSFYNINNSFRFVKPKFRLYKKNRIYSKAYKRIIARSVGKQNYVKKQNSLTIISLNKKKFKFFSRYLGMLTMRGNTGHLENSFLFILRNLKKIYLDKFTLRSYLTRVINQARPYAILVSQKKGSMTYRIPMYTTPNREIFQGLYWLINESCGLKKGNFTNGLFKEFVNLSSRTGKVMKVKADFHRLVQRNRSLIKKLDT